MRYGTNIKAVPLFLLSLSLFGGVCYYWGWSKGWADGRVRSDVEYQLKIIRELDKDKKPGEKSAAEGLSIPPEMVED